MEGKERALTNKLAPYESLDVDGYLIVKANKLGQ